MLYSLKLFFAALLVSASITAVLIPLARRYHWLDKPCQRKQHATPTPPVGGFGIFAAIALATVWINGLNPVVCAWLAGASLLVLVGALDDKYDVNWRLRILAQVAAALCLILWGGVRAEHLGPLFGLPDVELGWLSLPISVLGIVGLINALNMVDGIDGLCGSLIIAACLMFIAAGLYAGAPPIVFRLAMVVGAIAGFLLFNLRYGAYGQARAFLGDAGSGLLGFTIATVAFRMTQDPVHPVSPILAPYLVAVPVIDCLVLLVRRLRQGRSPFAGGRDHVHHLLLDAGFSVNQTVFALFLASLLIGGGAAVWLLLGVPYERGLLVLGYFGLLAAWYAFTCDWARAVARLAALHRRLTRAFRPA